MENLKNENFQNIHKTEGGADSVKDQVDTENYDIRDDLPEAIQTLHLWHNGEIEGEELTSQELINMNLTAASYYMSLAQQSMKEAKLLQNKLEDEER